MADTDKDDLSSDKVVSNIANMVSAGLSRYSTGGGETANPTALLYMLTALSLLNLSKDLDNNTQLLSTARRFASHGLSRAAKNK